MEINQKTYLEVEKGSKKVHDPDFPLGLLLVVIDALMELKGYVVERMVSAQKQEEAEANEQLGEKDEPKDENTKG